MMSVARIARALLLTGLLSLTGAAGVAAQTSWVGGEVKLNLRRGPSTEYKIIGSVSSEEPVTVLDSQDGWTQVRLENGQEGWIPGGYLSSEPPAAIRAERLETEARSLRDRLATSETEAERLRSENQSLSAAETEQRERITALTTENHELRALVRWREWITGASILAIGMIVGALLRRRSGRRRSDRLRL